MLQDTDREVATFLNRKFGGLIASIETVAKEDLDLVRFTSITTIDGCGEGFWRSGRGPQAILEGNHDNPESGTHQAPSHWEPQWKEAQILTKTVSREEGGLGAKNN